MVALAVRTFGQNPVTCNARPLLFRAHADLEAGRIIEAACRLREAVRVYLVAECEYWGCSPNKKAQRHPKLLIAALKKNEETADWGFSLLEETLDYCNSLAHCGFVRSSLIETCLSVVHMYLDAATYLQQPVAAGRLLS
jgi:hypothetical protein